jgi:hypothetical protein
MPAISVALDGSKRRDLQLFQGDTVTLTVSVYAHDGDATPLATVTDARFVDLNGAGFVYGTPFAVSENDVGRRWYRLVGEVAGVTTTLAFGFVIVEGNYAGWPCGCWPGRDYWVGW